MMSSMYKQFAYIVAAVLFCFVLVGGYLMFSTPAASLPVSDSSQIDTVAVVPSEQPVARNTRGVPQPQYQTRGCSWEWFDIRDVGLW